MNKVKKINAQKCSSNGVEKDFGNLGTHQLFTLYSFCIKKQRKKVLLSIKNFYFYKICPILIF